MEFDGIKTVAVDGEENDWLDVTYSERKYVEPSNTQKQNLWQKMSKRMRILAVACAIVLAFVGVVVFNADVRNGIVQTAKSAYLSVVSVLDKQSATNGKIDIPCNSELKQVVDGVATFGGGRATLSFCDGTVVAVDETSVTVQIDEETSLCYAGLTSVFVQVGQTVEASQLLAKYDGQFTTSVVCGGEVVTGVVASENQITWQI